MTISPIIEGACAAVLAHLVISLLKRPRDKRSRRLLRLLLMLPVLVLLWGELRGWPFSARYPLLCVSAFGIMLDFCLQDGPPTRWGIFAGIALPLFAIILGLLDPSVTLTITLPR